MSRSLFLLLFTLLAAPLAAAQTGVVTGRVVDGEFSLPTATVAVWTM